LTSFINNKKAVRLRLSVHYGHLRKATTSHKKSPPFVPHGLHGLLCGFRTINPAVVFFCHTFCKRQKRRLHSNRHHRATLAPEKNNSKLLYITCSYIRALAWRQINRAKYNLIMYNIRTKSTLLPRCAARRPTIIPSSLSAVAVWKNSPSFISLCLR